MASWAENTSAVRDHRSTFLPSGFWLVRRSRRELHDEVFTDLALSLQHVDALRRRFDAGNRDLCDDLLHAIGERNRALDQAWDAAAGDMALFMRWHRAARRFGQEIQRGLDQVAA